CQGAPPAQLAVWREKGTGPIRALASLPNRGQIAVAFTDGVIRMVDPATGSVTARLDAKEGDLDFLIPDVKEKWLAQIHGNGKVCIWDLEKRENDPQALRRAPWQVRGHRRRGRRDNYHLRRAIADGR